MRMARSLLLIVALAGAGACLRARTEMCSWGWVCPSGLVCDERHRECVLPEQLANCAGRDERSTCVYPEVVDGLCYDGVCLPQGCGNGQLDDGEVCDDGNLVGGDACSFDCRSDETCGNDYVDVATGESCDDGNDYAHDGCSTDCASESPTWTMIRLGGALVQLAAAPDATGAVISFGGEGTPGRDTRRWNGVTWERLDLAVQPLPREGHVMTYDSARQEVLVFGGNYNGGGTASATLGDTWIWDGGAWDERSPTTSPPNRAYGALAFDDTRDVAILFGGKVAIGLIGGQLDDTWQWDGATWVRRYPANRPSTRQSHAMAYDPVRDEIVLFGGYDGANTLSDTWVWNGTTWIERFPSTVPPAHSSHAMAWDPVVERIVMSGSAGGVWEWNGSNWSEVTDGTPPRRRNHAMAFDSARSRLVVCGGSGAYLYADTWERGESGWALVEDESVPDDRSHSMVYDGAAEAILVFASSTDLSVDTLTSWRWSGPEAVSTWTRLSPALEPSERTRFATSYAGSGQTILFGGDSGGPLDDTWIWDGDNWENVDPGPGPGPRARHAMSYDAARSRVVLFGGLQDGLRLGDTWEWDGSAWTEVTADPSPSPRYDHSMAYDPVRGVTVLFGGRSSSDEQGDTWEWDGNAWTEIATAVAPTPRRQHGLVYDPARGAIVLFGGRLGNDWLSSQWEWDGTQWLQTQGVVLPPARADMSAAFDESSGYLVLFGGGVRTDTWTFRWE